MTCYSIPGYNVRFKFCQSLPIAILLASETARIVLSHPELGKPLEGSGELQKGLKDLGFTLAEPLAVTPVTFW
jgi:hypothetical protein